jgi:hypothetical protein
MEYIFVINLREVGFEDMIWLKLAGGHGRYWRLKFLAGLYFPTLNSRVGSWISGNLSPSMARKDSRAVYEDATVNIRNWKFATVNLFPSVWTR